MSNIISLADKRLERVMRGCAENQRLLLESYVRDRDWATQRGDAVMIAELNMLRAQIETGDFEPPSAA